MLSQVSNYFSTFYLFYSGYSAVHLHCGGSFYLRFLMIAERQNIIQTMSASIYWGLRIWHMMMVVHRSKSGCHWASVSSVFAVFSAPAELVRPCRLLFGQPSKTERTIAQEESSLTSLTVDFSLCGMFKHNFFGPDAGDNKVVFHCRKFFDVGLVCHGL